MTSVAKSDLLVSISLLELLPGLALPRVNQAQLPLRDLYVPQRNGPMLPASGTMKLWSSLEVGQWNARVLWLTSICCYL